LAEQFEGEVAGVVLAQRLDRELAQLEPVVRPLLGE
jgi:hypothetical protein